MADHNVVYCARKFGQPDPHPRIIAVYSSREGWERPHHRTRLTPETAFSMRESGHTMAVMRWRLRAREVLLSSYLTG